MSKIIIVDLKKITNVNKNCSCYLFTFHNKSPPPTIHKRCDLLEVLIMIENKFKNDENYAKFLAYIEKFLFCRKIDFLRKMQRKINREILVSQDELEKFLVPVSDTKILEELETVETDLNGLFSILNKKEKLILVMFYEKNMDYATISRELGITEGSARNLKMNALKKIREMRGL